MDEDLARDALRGRERDLRTRRRARRTALALVVLAAAALGWQLAPAATSWWPFLTEWWPLVAAVVALVAAGVLWSRSRQRPTTTGAGAAERWSRIGGMVTTVTAVGALVFTAISLQATRDQIEVARQGQITDRYTRAVDQLGAEGAANLHRRLGGIYALERIAVDSPRDQATMVEVLSAFLRSTSPRVRGEPCPPTPADVAAAFAVLTRRDVTRDPGPAVIDLRELCLREVRAVDGDLSGMSLIGSDLSGANLSGARLGLTALSDATLVGASLYRADLTAGFVFATNADFTGARFDSAKLGSADFSGSTFTGADFEYADLGRSDFSGADLTGAEHTAQTKADGAVKDPATRNAWW
ncbi:MULTISPECIES: pentapeptide repeat-containing protein [Amycolatopsis]|uniref:pentapeptide repeat-containing protein n=1 Tax=Amycolatopsis TaxID=1813 RepID=UPI001F27FC4E|nr:pentapeptide repeat-containing protein [Amycolatopsis tucumanensis]MCF6421742.1 pentapeptide repeat-containing protein [Amycolatopsis tucumanensis]